jgi:hypothetical protein
MNVPPSFSDTMDPIKGALLIEPDVYRDRIALLAHLPHKYNAPYLNQVEWYMMIYGTIADLY